jgi:hypothetical protein
MMPGHFVQGYLQQGAKFDRIKDVRFRDFFTAAGSVLNRTKFTG